MKINYTRRGFDLQCPKCGAVIGDTKLHTEYHESLSKVKDFMDSHRMKT
ncbi:MAG: hypothetical protein HOD60_14970 [Candidatus Nitrosopelagicus sp.]|jgi:hypothetical protein|nr:hypothetical protein [Candidatus Nitrosopelagicus sp.]